MKRLKYLLCILAVALLTIISALAAEGEEPLQTGQIETQVLPQVERSNAQMLDISGTSSIQDNTLYQEIYEMLMDKQQYLDIEKYGFAINGDGPDQLLYYITAVLYDHPEIYYAKTGFSYSYNPSTGRITKITPMYIEEVMTDAAQEEINQAIAEAMVQADHPGLSDVEKALLLHDYLVNHVTYNWDIAVASTKEEMNAATEKAGPLVYTAYGAFVNGDAVCQGYALAYKLLLDKCGIDSTLVSSEAMNHVWNLVKIEGDPDGPLNKGGVCLKCLAQLQTLYSPRHVLHPMKRAGERGERPRQAAPEPKREEAEKVTWWRRDALGLLHAEEDGRSLCAVPRSLRMARLGRELEPRWIEGVEYRIFEQ